MTRLFADTHPDAEKVLLRIYREMSSADKFSLLVQMNKMARTLALQGLRERFLHASEAELERRLMDIVLGEELAEKVYGPIQE
jgi:hypothetical protein